MSGLKFIAYVGDEDIHDSDIVAVRRRDKDLLVVLSSGGWRRKQGTLYQLIFHNVTRVEETNPVGRCLYALVEVEEPGSNRRFVFGADDDQPCLDIVAENFSVESVQDVNG